MLLRAVSPLEKHSREKGLRYKTPPESPDFISQNVRSVRMNGGTVDEELRLYTGLKVFDRRSNRVFDRGIVAQAGKNDISFGQGFFKVRRNR